MSKLSADRPPHEFASPPAAATNLLGEAGRLSSPRAQLSPPHSSFPLSGRQTYLKGRLEDKKTTKEDGFTRLSPSVHFQNLAQSSTTTTSTAPRSMTTSSMGRPSEECSRLQLSENFSELCVCSEENFNMWLIDVVVGIPPLSGQANSQVEDSDNDAPPYLKKKNGLNVAFDKLQQAIVALERYQYKLLGQTHILDAYYEALEEDIRQGNDPLRKNSEFHYHLRESRRAGVKGKYAFEQKNIHSRLEKLYYVVSKLEATKDFRTLKIPIAPTATMGDVYTPDKSSTAVSKDKEVLGIGENPLGVAHAVLNALPPSQQGGTSADFSLVDIPYPPLKGLPPFLGSFREPDGGSMGGKHQNDRDSPRRQAIPPNPLAFHEWRQSLETLERRAKELQDRLALPLPASEVISRLRNELLFSFSARVLALRDSNKTWGCRRVKRAVETRTTADPPPSYSAATSSLSLPPLPAPDAPSSSFFHRRVGGSTGSFVEWYVNEIVDPFALRQLLTMVPLDSVVTTTCRLIYAREAQQQHQQYQQQQQPQHPARRIALSGEKGSPRRLKIATPEGVAVGEAAAPLPADLAALPDLSHVVLCAIQEGRVGAFAKLILSSVVSFLDARYLALTKVLFFYAALLSGQIDLVECMLGCEFFHDQALHVLLFLSMNAHDADCAAFLDAQLHLVKATLLEYQESADENCTVGKPLSGKILQDASLASEESGQQLLEQSSLLFLQHDTSELVDNDRDNPSENKEENFLFNSKQTLSFEDENQETESKGDEDALLTYYGGYDRLNRSSSLRSNASPFSSFLDGSVQRLRLFLQVRRLALDKEKREKSPLNIDTAIHSSTQEALLHNFAKKIEERLERAHLKEVVSGEGPKNTLEEPHDEISFNDLLLHGMLDAWSIGSPDAITMPSYSTLYLRRVGLRGYVPLRPTARPILVRGDTYVELLEPTMGVFPSRSCGHSTPLPKATRSKAGKARLHGNRSVFYYEGKVSVDFLLPPVRRGGAGAHPMTNITMGWCTEEVASLGKEGGRHPPAPPIDPVSVLPPPTREGIVDDGKPNPEELLCGEIPRNGLGATQGGFGVSLQLIYQKPREPAVVRETASFVEEVEEIVWGVWRHCNGETTPVMRNLTDPTKPPEMVYLRILRRDICRGTNLCPRRFGTIYPKVEVITKSDLNRPPYESDCANQSGGKGSNRAGEEISTSELPPYGHQGEYGVLVDDEMPLYGTHALNFGFAYDIVKDEVSLFVNGAALGVVFSKISATTSGSPRFRRLYPAATLLATQEMVDEMQFRVLDMEEDEDIEREKPRLGAARNDRFKNATDEPNQNVLESATVLRFAFDKDSLIFYNTIEEYFNLNKALIRLGVRDDVSAYGGALGLERKGAKRSTASLKPLQLFDRSYKLRLLLRILTSSHASFTSLSAHQAAENAGVEGVSGTESSALMMFSSTIPSASTHPELIGTFSKPLMRGGQNRKPGDGGSLGLTFHCPVWIPRRTGDPHNVKNGGYFIAPSKPRHFLPGGADVTRGRGTQAHMRANYSHFIEGKDKVYTIIAEDIPLSPLCAALAFRLPYIAYDILSISPLSALHLSDETTVFSKVSIHSRRIALLAACALGYEEVVRVLCKFIPPHEILKLFGIQMTSDELKQMQDDFCRRKQTALLSYGGERSMRYDRSDYFDGDPFWGTSSISSSDYSIFSSSVSLDTLYVVRRGLYTPLHCALLGGNHTECAMVLTDFLQKCLAPSTRSRAAVPPPHLSFLSEALNMLTPLGESALAMAARHNNIDLTVRLLELGAKATAVDRSTREHVLEIACANGCVPIALALLDARREGQDRYDASLLNHVGVASCLCWSALNNLPEIIPLLLSRGADPQIMLEDSSPLLLAVTFGNEQAALALLEHTYSRQEVAKLVRQENEDAPGLSVQTTLDSRSLDGAEVVKKTQTRKGPFHGSEKPILDVDAIEPRSHCTALHIACELGQKQVVQVLLSKGASLDIRSKTNGYTPLHTALLNNQEDVAMTLLAFSRNKLRHGMCVLDLLASDVGGNTTLHVAARQGASSVVEYLLEQFSDEEISRLRELRPFTTREPAVGLISVANNQGRTPLLVAIHAGHAFTAQVIISLTPQTTQQPGGPVIEGTCVALLQAMKNGLHEVVMSMLTLGSQGLYPASEAFRERFFALYNPLQEGSEDPGGGGSQEAAESETDSGRDDSLTNRSSEAFDGRPVSSNIAGTLTNSMSTSVQRANEGSGGRSVTRSRYHTEAVRERNGRSCVNVKATNYTEALMSRTRTQTKGRKITSSTHSIKAKEEPMDGRTHGQTRRSFIMRALLVRGRAITPTSPPHVISHLLRGFALPEVFLMLELVSAESPVVGIQNPSAMIHGEAITGFLQEHCDVYVAPTRVVPFCKEVFQYLQEHLSTESHHSSLATPHLWWLNDAQMLQTWRVALQKTAKLKDIDADSALCHQLTHVIRLYGRRNNGLTVLEEMEGVVNHYMNKVRTSQKDKPCLYQPGKVSLDPKGDRKVDDHTNATSDDAVGKGSDAVCYDHNSFDKLFTEEMFEGLFNYSILQLSASLELPHVVSFFIKKFHLNPLHAPAQRARREQGSFPSSDPTHPKSQQRGELLNAYMYASTPHRKHGPDEDHVAHDTSWHSMTSVEPDRGSGLLGGVPHPSGFPLKDLNEQTDAKWLLSPFRIALRTLNAPTVVAFLTSPSGLPYGGGGAVVEHVEPPWVDPFQRSPLEEVLGMMHGMGPNGRAHGAGRDPSPRGRGTHQGSRQASPVKTSTMTPRMARALEVCEQLLLYGATTSGHFDANGMDAWMLAVSIDGYAGERATTLLLASHKKYHSTIGVPEDQENYVEMLQRWHHHNFGLSLNVTSIVPMSRLPRIVSPNSNDHENFSLVQQTDTGLLRKGVERSRPGCNPLGASNFEQHHSSSIAPHPAQTTTFISPRMHSEPRVNLESKRSTKAMVFSPLGSKLFTAKIAQQKDPFISSVPDDSFHTGDSTHEDMGFQYYYYVTLLFATAEHNPALLKTILKEIKFTHSTQDQSAISVVHPITKDTLLTFILKKAYRHSLLLSGGLPQVPCQGQTNIREGTKFTFKRKTSLLLGSIHSHKSVTQGASRDSLPQVPPRTLTLQSVQPLLRVAMSIANLMETPDLYHSAGDGETALSIAVLIGHMGLVRQLVLAKPSCPELLKLVSGSASLQNTVGSEVAEGGHRSKQTEGEQHPSDDQYHRLLLISNLSDATVRANIATRLYYDEVDGETLFTILSCIATEAGKSELINFLTMVYPNLHPIPALQITAAYASYATYFLTAPACMNAFWVNLLYAQYAGRLAELNITTAKWDLLLHALLPGAPAAAVYLIQKKCPALENPMNGLQGASQGGRHRLVEGVEIAEGASSPLQCLRGDNRKPTPSPKEKKSNRVPLNPWSYISSRVSLLLQMMALTAADTLIVKPTGFRSFLKAPVSAEATAPLLLPNGAKTYQNSYETSHDKGTTVHLSSTTPTQNNSKKGLRISTRDLASLVSTPRNEREREGMSVSSQRTRAGGGGENALACGWAHTLLGDVAELAVRYDDVDVFLDLVRLRIPRQVKQMPSKLRMRDQSPPGSKQGRNGNGGTPSNATRSQFADPSVAAALTAASAYCPSLASVHNTYQLNSVLEKLQSALWRDIIEDKHVDLLAVAAGSIRLLRYLYESSENWYAEEEAKGSAVLQQLMSPLRYDRIDMLTGIPEGISSSMSKSTEIYPRTGANVPLHTSLSTVTSVPKALEMPCPVALVSNSSFTSKLSTTHRILGEDSIASIPEVSKEEEAKNHTHHSRGSHTPTIFRHSLTSGHSSRPGHASFRGTRGGLTVGEQIPDEDDVYNSGRWVGNSELGADFTKRHKVMAVLWGTGAAAKTLEYGSGRCKGFAAMAAPLLNLTVPPCPTNDDFRRSPLTPGGHSLLPSQQKGANALHMTAFHNIDPTGFSNQSQSQRVSPSIASNSSPRWFMYLIGDWCMHNSLVLHSPHPSLVSLDVLEFFMNRRAPLSFSVLRLFLTGTWFSFTAKNEQPQGGWWQPPGWRTRGGQPLSIHYQSPAHGDTLLHLLVINDQCELAEYYLAYCLYYFVRSGLDAPLPPAYHSCVPALLREVEPIKEADEVSKGAHSKPSLPVHFLRTMLRCNSHGLTPMDYAHNPGMIYLLHSYGCVPPTYHLHPQRLSRWLGFRTPDRFQPSGKLPRITAGDRGAREGKGGRKKFVEPLRTCFSTDARNDRKVAFPSQWEREEDFFPVPRLVLISEDLLSYHDDIDANTINRPSDCVQGRRSYITDMTRRGSQLQGSSLGKGVARRASLSAPRVQTEISDAALFRALLMSQRLTNDFIKSIILSDDVSLLHIGLCSSDDELVQQYCSLAKHSQDRLTDEHTAMEGSASSVKSAKLNTSEARMPANATIHDVPQPPPISQILYLLPPLPGVESYLKLNTSVLNSLTNSYGSTEGIEEAAATETTGRKVSLGNRSKRHSSQVPEERESIPTTAKRSICSNQSQSHGPAKHVSYITLDLLNSLERRPFVVYPLSLRPLYPAIEDVEHRQNTLRIQNLGSAKSRDSTRRVASKKEPQYTSSNAFFMKMLSIHRHMMALASAEEAKKMPHKSKRELMEDASLLIALTPMQLAMACGAVKRGQGGSPSGAVLPYQYQSTLLRGGAPPFSSMRDAKGVGEGSAGEVFSAPVQQPPPFSLPSTSGAALASALDAWVASERGRLNRGRAAATAGGGRLSSPRGGLSSGPISPIAASSERDTGAPSALASKGAVAKAEQQRLMGLLLSEFDRCLGVERVQAELGLAISPNYDVSAVGDAVAAARQSKAKKDPQYKKRHRSQESRK
ncbi:unnamed protein product [Phytomonas sp. EM1]|nr:unnamed protein product [Phytomonas sp. EM1]|eukprot:CCW64705.1 unnamed protein product [Phytomonas sp. isolate EM1]